MYSSDINIKIKTYREKCNYTVEQQRKWLLVLSETIPTIKISISPENANPLYHDYYLHPRKIKEARNIYRYPIPLR